MGELLIPDVELPSEVTELIVHPDGSIYTKDGEFVSRALIAPKHGKLVEQEKAWNSVHNVCIKCDESGDINDPRWNCIWCKVKDAKTAINITPLYSEFSDYLTDVVKHEEKFLCRQAGLVHKHLEEMNEREIKIAMSDIEISKKERDMDLGAYSLCKIPEVKKYINKHYGEIPRLRGVRFMAIQKPEDADEDDVIFRKYCGKDVIYIHTRCGDCGLGWDNSSSNYKYFGANKWEDSHKKLFIEHESDDFDPTYGSHYFKPVVNAEYAKILNLIKSLMGRQ